MTLDLGTSREAWEQDSRYSRQELITWWDQARLREAQVLVVGAGALGNEIVKNLALIGVGQLAVVDPDTVETSNLARCPLFRPGDEAEAKAPLLAERASELNPEVDVNGVRGNILHDVGLTTFIDADLVLCGLDNREARLFVNAACWKTSTPWVDGAIEGLMGTVRVFLPPDSACYESTMTAEDHRLLAQRRSCALLTVDEMADGKVPTTATTASVIAAIQVQEAVKLLHEEVGSSLVGKGLIFNGLSHDTYTVSYEVQPDAQSRDTYELAGARTVEPETSFGELLELAREGLGPEAALVLEREVVDAFTCSNCETSEPVRRAISALRPGEAECPGCGTQRGVVLRHRVEAGDGDLLALTPTDLGMPPGDCVTAQTASERRFFLLGSEESLFR